MDVMDYVQRLKQARDRRQLLEVMKEADEELIETIDRELLVEWFKHRWEEMAASDPLGC